MRILVCWTPLSCLYLSYDGIKMECCPTWENRDRLSEIEELTEDYSNCWSCGYLRQRLYVGWCFDSCIHSNLVPIHFMHRFIIQLIQLLIIYIFYNNELQLSSFVDTIFLIAIICVILTPCLFILLIQRWIIQTESESGGLEMNIFGFVHQAHEEDDITMLMEYVDSNPQCVNDRNQFDRTPIMESVLLNNFEIFKFLINNRHVDLTLRDCDDKHIIHLIAQQGDSRFLHILLETRKKAIKTSRQLQLQGVVGHDSHEFDCKMFDIDDVIFGALNKTALIICCEQGHWQCAQELLNNHANYNHIDGRGRTCLHYAIFGESKTKNTFDSITGDIDLRKKAQHQDFTNILYKLLMYDDINLECGCNRRQWTPLMQAVGGGTLDVVEKLLYPKYFEWQQERLIWIAFYKNNENEKCLINLFPKDIVKEILRFVIWSRRKGANMDCVDIKGESLLHIAVRYNQVDVLKYLLTNGNHGQKWNLNDANIENDTPLKLSVYGKYEECLRVLSPFESQKSLRKALLLAVKTNAVDLVNFLLKECHISMFLFSFLVESYLFINVFFYLFACLFVCSMITNTFTSYRSQLHR